MNAVPILSSLPAMPEWNAYHGGFLPWFVAGGVLAVAVMIFGRARQRRLARFACWLLAVLLLWAALVLGVGAGYEAWQSTPDPLGKAYADGGAMVGTLFFGWIYSGVLCAACWALLVLISRIREIGSRSPAT